MVNGQEISANLLDTPRDSEAVQRPQYIESLEDHQSQDSLQDLGFLFQGNASLAILVSNTRDGTLPLGKQQVSRAAGGEPWRAGLGGVMRECMALRCDIARSACDGARGVRWSAGVTGSAEAVGVVGEIHEAIAVVDGDVEEPE